MLKLGKKLEILRLSFVENKAIKEIARELKISKNTVKNYIREYEIKNKELLSMPISNDLLIESMLDKPKYNVENRKSVVMTDEIKDLLNKYIQENFDKLNNNKRKYIMTAVDMYEELLEKGFAISYPSVAQYVQKYKEIKKEAYIKQEYDFGDTCEFDWGEVVLTIDNKIVKYRMAVFTLAKSNYRFAYLYEHENMQSFLDAHIRLFNNIKGVPLNIIYDNMKVAVAKFVGRIEKEATQDLQKISIYYGFKYRFCNIASGNEKGHVENSVEFVRRKSFCACSSFNNKQEALDRLKAKLIIYNNSTNNINKKSATELLYKEQEVFISLKHDFVNCSITSARVDKLSTISYQKNRYSVPDYLVGKVVEVRSYIDKIKIVYNNIIVAEHIRCFKNAKFTLNIFHYKHTLTKKPGALKGSLAFSQMSDILKEIYNNYFTETPRQFIELLNIVSEYSIDKIIKIINVLNEKSIDVNIDNIKIILYRNDKNMLVINSNEILQKEIEQFSKQQLCEYDNLANTFNVCEVATV